MYRKKKKATSIGLMGCGDSAHISNLTQYSLPLVYHAINTVKSNCTLMLKLANLPHDFSLICLGFTLLDLGNLAKVLKWRWIPLYIPYQPAVLRGCLLGRTLSSYCFPQAWTSGKHWSTLAFDNKQHMFSIHFAASEKQPVDRNGEKSLCSAFQ